MMLTIALDIVREQMFVLLIAGGIIYVFQGDVREDLILLGSIFLIMGITFDQEQKTERALEVLRDLSRPRPCHSRRETTVHRWPGGGAWRSADAGRGHLPSSFLRTLMMLFMKKGMQGMGGGQGGLDGHDGKDQQGRE